LSLITAPLIDQVQRLMHLWKAGEESKVNEYLDEKGLRRHALFNQLLQALIELAEEGSEERALMEAISNHLAARGLAPKREERLPGMEEKTCLRVGHGGRAAEKHSRDSPGQRPATD